MILQSTIKGQIIPAPTYVCWKSKFQVLDKAFIPSVGNEAKPPAHSHRQMISWVTMLGAGCMELSVKVLVNSKTLHSRWPCELCQATSNE